MKSQLRRVLQALPAAAGVVFSSLLPAAAQHAPGSGSRHVSEPGVPWPLPPVSFSPRRTADGVPDLQGHWGPDRTPNHSVEDGVDPLDGVAQNRDSDTAVFLHNYNHAYRIIPTDGRPHLSENIRLWMGDSRGRWEGNTLVVEVTNTNDKPWFDSHGTFRGTNPRMVERRTLIDADTM